MDTQRLYNDLLKNLFHEQVTTLVPLLLPGFYIEEVFDVEMPDLISTPLERAPTSLEEGIVGLAVPEAQIVQVYHTEWIEHSGAFERAYRVTTSETEKPCFLIVEVQTNTEDPDEFASELLSHFASINLYIREHLLPEHEDEDTPPDRESASAAQDPFQNEAGDDQMEEWDDADTTEEDQDDEAISSAEVRKGTLMNPDHYSYPYMLCPFPKHVPKPIRNEFMGRLTLAFNFPTIHLWEKDAREFLNNHAYAAYYLLPTMKNADAELLKLAIGELIQHFQADQSELARHLTGLSLMLRYSETITDEERSHAQDYLHTFAHLLDETLI